MVVQSADLELGLLILLAADAYSPQLLSYVNHIPLGCASNCCAHDTGVPRHVTLHREHVATQAAFSILSSFGVIHVTTSQSGKQNWLLVSHPD